MKNDRTVFERVPRFNEMLVCGQKMSNVCYNLGQRPGEPLEASDAKAMMELSKEWIMAMTSAAREMRSLLEAEELFDPIKLGC